MPEADWIEADIVINGKRLTLAQSMTLRVAIGSFLFQMSETGALGNGSESLRKGYCERASEVQDLIFLNLNK